jgi:hypothetical protein
VDVKSINRRIRITLLSVVLLAGTSFADESDTIISEWKAAIQILNTSEFVNWPGVSGSIPSDISMSGGRTWLIWPGCLINLDFSGRPDIETLLTIFAAQSTDWPGGRWSPENGTLGSDGHWIGFSVPDSIVTSLDTRTGEVVSAPWNESIPDVIHPLPEGVFFTLSGPNASLLHFSGGHHVEVQALEESVPPLAQLAVSSRYPVIAWREALGEDLRTAGGIESLPGSENLRTLDRLAETLHQFPWKTIAVPGNPWSMDWSGEYLILAGPGRLTALRPFHSGDTEMVILEDRRLPRRWYRIKGGADSLGILLPESERVVLVIPDADKDTTLDTPDFSMLLRNYALAAGEMLEKTESTDAAERYYGWILPYVRQERSAAPLDELWALLEKDLTERRTAIRDSWE